MLKTYRIIPLVFILFLFGFTFSTVSPLFAQTVDQLIESIEKLDANDRARVLEYKYSPPNRPSDATPAAAADGPWDKSMGMRHPDRPCMKVNSCAPDTRSPEEIASDPFDTNNPVSLAARERVAAGLSPEDTNEVPHGKVRCICAGFGCIARCGHCEGIGAGTTPCQICALADGKLKC